MVQMRIAFVMVLLGRALSADERSAAARDHYAKGTTAFDLGQFEDAVHEYTEAYRLRDDPALLYNIAQSNRLAGHKAEALHFYRIYLTKVPHAPNREQVVAKVAELQKAIEQEKKAQTMPPNEAIEPKPAAPDEKAEKPADEKQRPHLVEATPPVTPMAAPRNDGAAKRLQIAGGVVGALGLGALAGAVATTLLAQQAAGNLSRAAAAHEAYDPAQYSALESNRLAAGILYGVGGAALIAGVAVLSIGVKRGRAPAAAATLKVRPRLAGLTVEGSF
jgi:hypothetical protein